MHWYWVLMIAWLSYCLGFIGGTCWHSLQKTIERSEPYETHGD